MKALKKSLSIMLTAALMFTSAVPVMADTAAEPSDNADAAVPSAAAMVDAGEYADDEVIVVFADSVRDKKIENVVESSDAECVEITSASEDTKMAVAEISSGTSVEEAIVDMQANEEVLYVQPNYKYKVSTENGTNDPYNNDEGLNQWYLTNIKAREAWDVLQNSGLELNTARVAVIDTGADIRHEDLAANISEDSVRILGHEIVTLTGDSSYEGHGTHVSGIIAAVADNEKGIAGVASGAGNDLVELIAIDATSQDEPGEYFDTYGLVSAINYAIEKDADVINMSLGGFGTDLVMEDAVEDAYAAGITVVAAAGNEGSDEAVTPADSNEVISVCNTTREDRRYVYEDGWTEGSSNYGQAKDIAAPGTTIISTIPGGYDNYTGTSMSSPVVSAAAAMLYMVDPDLTPAQVKNILCVTARDIDEEGFDYYTGYGVVNTLDAVNAVIAASADEKITSIEFKEDSAYVDRINKGQEKMLEAVYYPATSLETVTWSSSDESVVTVDSNGKASAVAPGTATVTCSSSGTSASYNIEVRDIHEPEEVVVNNQSEVEEMNVGDLVLLETSVLPRYADDKNVYWKSSDMSIVTVDELGYVTARNEGEAYIIGYTYNAPCKEPTEEAIAAADARTAVIKVRVAKSVESVTITDSKDKIRMGTTYTFKATAAPEDAADKEIKWKSSNRAVASIDEKTGELTPVSPGKVTITASTSNNKSDSMRILIYKIDYAKSDYNLTATSAGAYSVKLKWKAIPNADGYKIYRNGKLIKTVAAGTTTFTNKNLYCGVTYKYSVRAFYGSDLCAPSAVKTAKPIPLAPKVSSKSSKGKITVSWNKIPSATKYVVYKYNKSKGKYVAVKTVKGTSYTDKNVCKGKSYSYKVRVFRNTEKAGRVWSKYSNVTKRICK